MSSERHTKRHLAKRSRANQVIFSFYKNCDIQTKYDVLFIATTLYSMKIASIDNNCSSNERIMTTHERTRLDERDVLSGFFHSW